VAGLPPPTILIIDNDASLVAFLAFFFEDKGFTVYTADDGTEGVALAHLHKPRIILSDVMMGRLHGFDVLVQLRAEPELRDAIIIMMSAKSYRSDIERARALGATDYVIKPFKTEELFALVQRRLHESDATEGRRPT
jgi:DNA-binding response OmpR family regulator